MHTETAKQRREKRKAQLYDTDEDEDSCNFKAARRAAPYILIFLALLPYDVVMWSSPDLISLVPFTRLVRLIPAPLQALQHIEKIEKSQAITFVLARTIRLVVMLLITLHWVSCVLTFAARQPDASHYSGAPWWTQDEEGDDSLQYLHAIYWALMTVLAVGHKNVVNEEGTPQNGQVWEFLTAVSHCYSNSGPVVLRIGWSDLVFALRSVSARSCSFRVWSSCTWMPTSPR